MSTVFITGASAGIGRAAVNYFANKGWNVVAAMRSPEKETEFTSNSSIQVVKLDVEQPADIQAAVGQAIQHFGKIDVLINNAGIGMMGIFEAMSDEQIRRQFEVNVFGLIHMTKAILPHFRSNKGGTIINISSMGGRIAFPAMSMYHATKYAVEGFSESISYELASQNIKVKLIEPGSVDTGFKNVMGFFFPDSGEMLMDYQQFMTSYRQKMSTASEGMLAGTSTEHAAETIYLAATDGSDQFRYVVGQDAEVILGMRKQLDDETFMKQISKQFI